MSASFRLILSHILKYLWVKCVLLCHRWGLLIFASFSVQKKKSPTNKTTSTTFWLVSHTSENVLFTFPAKSIVLHCNSPILFKKKRVSELQKLLKLVFLSLLPDKKCRHPRKYFSMLISIDLLSIGKSVPSAAQVVCFWLFSLITLLRYRNKSSPQTVEVLVLSLVPCQCEEMQEVHFLMGVEEIRRLWARGERETRNWWAFGGVCPSRAELVRLAL